jgi:hypothetical protein
MISLRQRSVQRRLEQHDGTLTRLKCHR